MDSTAYIAQRWDSEQGTVLKSPKMAPSLGSMMSMYAQIRKEVEEEVRVEYQQLLDGKDREIELLRKQVEMMQNYSVSTSSTLSPPVSRTYNYNASCFSKPNAESIIDALIALADSKREGGKYIISTKTDWFMVWKVLHHSELYIGNEYDFIYLVNDCVIPYIAEAERQNSLSVTDRNFKTIRPDSPAKRFPVDKWRREFENERLSRSINPTQHGTLILDRGVNIMVKLQLLLKGRGIESRYFEK